ncbi:MAG TPA: hypothetical protein VED85_08110, partial [Burkholderiaceae bacterium]|nr:hypothetical protein [Burkholderiaceae bacterium]
MPVPRVASATAPATPAALNHPIGTRPLVRASGAKRPQPDCALRLHIDESMFPLRAIPAVRLNAEIGERLRQIAPIERCLCVLIDHGCAGLEAIAPRMHGTLSAELQHLYAALIFERDP